MIRKGVLDLNYVQSSQVFSANCFSKSLQRKKFGGLYLMNPSMDFPVMGLKLKLIFPSLIGYGFTTLAPSATEKSEEKEEASEPVLFTEPGRVLNRNGSDASSLSSDFSVTERTNFMKPYPMREG